MLAEIEDPRYHPAVGDIDPARRVAFYARLAAQMVVGPYFQLQLGGEGKKRMYGMFLAVLYGGDKASISASQLAAFLREYFRTGEGSDWPSAEDAEGRWLLDWYRARETVDLRPIAEYSTADIPRVPGRRATPREALRTDPACSLGAIDLRSPARDRLPHFALASISGRIIVACLRASAW